MNAAIVAIGDELTLGQTVDTNSAWLAARLIEHGVLTILHLTVPDDQPAIVEALRRTADAAPLVIVTGGLGPTADDLTRQALAQLLGVELYLHPPSLERIEQFFRERGRTMPEGNRLQAMCPVGGNMLDNPVGTAPGMMLRHPSAEIFCLPGVPHEMEVLFDLHVKPKLLDGRSSGGQVILTAKLNTFGTGESVVAEKLGDLMDRQRNPLVGTTVSDGIIAVRIRSTFATRREAQAQLDDTLAQACQRLGKLVFGSGDQALQQVLGQQLNKCQRTLATAESCTGGLLGKYITDATGSSRYYLGGLITYSNEAKVRDLNVDPSLLKAHGAVSQEVAIAMALGTQQRCDSDFAISITGIAGPGADGSDKPVGTVWIALAERDRPTTASLHQFAGDRSTIRDRSAKTAMNMLRLRLLDP